MASIQRLIESVISFSRWLVVPITLGLALADRLGPSRDQE